jgi:HK97 family phage major capsid protein
MSAKLRALQARKADQIKAAREFNDATEAKAAAENRGWTAEETTQYESLLTAAAGTDAAIDRERVLSAQEAGMTAALPAGASHVDIGAAARVHVAENTDSDPRRGFKSFGDYAKSVRAAALGQRQGIAMDQRLVPLAAAPSTFSGEGSASDGGILIPSGFSKDIFTLSLMEDALLPLTDNMPIDGNNMLIPKDETTPWGTNGVRAYWQSEATAGTPTKPVLGGMDLRLKKLMALVPVSDEMVADTSALDAYLPTKVAASIRWKTNEAILFGAGNGTPVGALSGGAVVTQAKDSGQATLTLSATNLANMISRLPPGSFPRAVWLINNNVLPALFTITLGNYPIYLPAGAPVGGLQNSPYGSLLGRPIVISQHAKSFTSQGDVILVDLNYYQAITKAEGVQTATSMHLYFDADALAFRTTFRMDGQPKIAAPISPANGSTTLSPFVQLASR